MDSKRFKRVTRADVAKRANVSETIVSYVINNNRYVAADKRKRVEDAVKELNYFPNNVARALKRQKSNHIVFIADQITNEHFSKLISEMDNYAYDKGFMISLCANRNTEAFVSQIISRQYDGIIISSISFPEEYIRKFITAEIPVVVLKNRDYNNIQGAGTISTGLYRGARECVKHLVSRGRKTILYIDRFSASGNFSTMEDFRYRGFVEQMKDSNLKISEDNIITGCANREEVASEVKQRIKSGFNVDAIFGRNDQMACIGMKAVSEMGYVIPKDIAVIGFDNSSLSQYTTPTLTTVDMPRKEIGRAAIKMLIKMIDQKEVPDPVAFEVEIIKHKST